MALNIPPYEAQYDEFGRPLHPIAAAIHNSSFNPPATVDPTGMYTPVPQEMKTQPVQRMNSPSYPPINPSTIPLTPNQQAREALQPPNPNDPKYKNSTLRTILNSVAAGLTGASNPAAGIQLAKSLRDAKYNREKRSYDVQYGKLEDTEKIEEQNRQDALRRSSEDRMLRSSESEAQARIAADRDRNRQLSINEQKERDTTADNASKDAARKATEDRLNEQTKQLKQRDDALNAIMQEQDPGKKKVLQDQYNNTYYKSTPKTEYNDPDTAAAIQAAKDKQAISPEGKAANQSRAVSRITATGTPEALTAEEKAAKAHAAGTQAGNTSPEAIDGQAKLTRAKSLAQLTANEKDVSHKAQIALRAVPDIRKDVDAASDTLFADRWKEFRTKTLGTEDSAKYAALRANTELLQTIVSQVHTGNKGVSKILDKFTNMFNVDKMNKQTFVDSLNAVEKWLQRYSTLPKIDGGYDLGDIDKQVESGATGKFGTIQKQ